MFYRFARFVLLVFYKIFYRLKVEGAENMPPDGGTLICSNHIKWADPLVLAISVKRSIHFMGKKEAFSIKFFAFFLKRLNAFPVDRATADMRAYKEAIGLLSSGNVMGIFVQGHRSADVDIEKAKSGAAFFALKSNCQVIPVRINSDYKLFSEISVKFGKPVEFDGLKNTKIDSAKTDALTEKIITAINGL